MVHVFQYRGGKIFLFAYADFTSKQIVIISPTAYKELLFRRLGACNVYLSRSVRGQVKRVFFTPVLVGTAGITASEAAGLLASLGIIAAVSVMIYGVYRVTLRAVCRSWNIR